VLTEMGRIAFRYAEEIFGLGQEMLDAFEGRPTGRPPRVTVGVANVVPKLIAYRLLEPALRLPDAVQLECLEDHPERLVAELALHRLDVVLSDAPAPPTVRVQAFSHLLGECGVSIFATRELDLSPGRGRHLRGRQANADHGRGSPPRVKGQRLPPPVTEKYAQNDGQRSPAPAARERPVPGGRPPVHRSAFTGHGPARRDAADVGPRQDGDALP
jgi:DNA-binding transcriptional LysR family regulator